MQFHCFGLYSMQNSKPFDNLRSWSEIMITVADLTLKIEIRSGIETGHGCWSHPSDMYNSHSLIL